MEAKILVRTFYDSEAHFLPLQESAHWFSERDNIESYVLKPIVFYFIVLCTVYASCWIFRQMYLYMLSSASANGSENCPICLEVFSTPVRINCGHEFCAECLQSYFENADTQYNCPLCKVVLLSYSSTDAESVGH